MSESDLESVREKRSSRRIRSLNLTSYTPRKGEEQQYIVSIGRTLDVSEGGVKVETHRQRPPDWLTAHSPPAVSSSESSL